MLRLQGEGEIKVKLHRPVEGTIKTATIKREAGHWYVLFNTICPIAPMAVSTEAVGIDVGLTSFAVLSDGTAIANPRYSQRGEARLRIAQRRVARRVKGSGGRRKAVQLLRRATGHVANQRADFQHKTARALVNRYGLISVEDLNVKGMAASMLAKSIHDAGWGMFLQRISDKAECAGRIFVRVDPRGTTQNCSGCGVRVPKTLSQRWHLCPSCGLSLSRDENAAREILGRGLRLASLTWPAGASVGAEAASAE